MKSRRFPLAAAAALLLSFCVTTPLRAEETKDTPGAVVESMEVPVQEEVETPGIIRPQDIENHHQVDVYFNWEGKREANTSPQTNVPVLFRVDTGPTTELRLAWGGVTWQGGNTGFKDLVLGEKWNFLRGKTSMGVLFLVECPSGTAGFQDPEFEPGAVLSYNYAFTDDLDLTLNGGLQLMVDGTSRQSYLQGSYAGQVGFNFGEHHRMTTAFTGYGPDQTPGGITRLAAHLGYTYMPDAKTDYTVILHRGFGPRGVDWGFTIGTAQRF